jgi:hypothetical protein
VLDKRTLVSPDAVICAGLALQQCGMGPGRHFQQTPAQHRRILALLEDIGSGSDGGDADSDRESQDGGKDGGGRSKDGGIDSGGASPDDSDGSGTDTQDGSYDSAMDVQDNSADSGRDMAARR